MLNLLCIFQKACFRFRTYPLPSSFLRRMWWTIQGAQFGRGTHVPPLSMTWPNQVCVGQSCTLERDVSFKFDGIWRTGRSIVVRDRVFLGKGCEFNIREGISIGSDCLIASGCKFIDHDHGTELGEMMNVQLGREAAIVLEDNVWLGVNVVVLKGVHIATGAIVGAGAVVTKSIGKNEIWGGIPARKIGERSPVQT